MPTNEQLRRERDALRAKASALKARNQSARENKALRREVRELQNPRTAAFKRNLRSGIAKGGRSTMRFIDDLTRPIPSKKAKKR